MAMVPVESTQLSSAVNPGEVKSSCVSPDNHRPRLRLAERVYDYVVSNITSGKFAPTKRISQRDIASQLSVSHIPVREAMEKLLQHGWIDRYPQKGTYVKNHTIEEISEIYQIREFQEAEAIRILAQTITGEQIRQLRDIEKQLVAASRENDTKKYVEVDMQFHARIIKFLNNKRLNGIYESVLLQSRCFMMAGAVRVSLVWREGMEDHLDFTSHGTICDALEKRDVNLAEQLIRKHIRSSCDLAIMIKKCSDRANKKI